mmetsp:Transcript_41449/g.70972  ORF Transcript_41449/g.70972 Transcript_41449/m.70972 type:complete len:178 (-) Transcript_41449:1359-1892(-)
MCNQRVFVFLMMIIGILLINCNYDFHVQDSLIFLRFVSGASSLFEFVTRPKYLCNIINIAATTRSDVFTATFPWASMQPQNAKRPMLPSSESGMLHSQETMKYPGDALHSSHVEDIIESSRESYHIFFSQREFTSTKARRRVAFTRSISAGDDEESRRRRRTDCASAFRNEAGGSRR